MTVPQHVRAYIGLGSNLADPQAQVEAAFFALDALPQTRLLCRSRLYVSAPWGRLDQPEFINAAAEIETELSPRDLMQALLAVERTFGRTRNGDRWGPRILDLDLILYGDRVVDEPGLHVPHPHLHERAFVLQPLADIAPQIDIPGHGPIGRVLAGVDTSGCQVLESRSKATG
jgi:2-amino-4-hydroxy-6-hydroxymethyldihydropteridine diphosphokinase